MASTTSTVSSVNASASAVTLFAARSGVYDGGSRMIFNDSTADLYLKFGSGATTSSFTVKIPASGYYEIPAPLYDGLVTGVWSSATGAARSVLVDNFTA